MKNLCSKPKDHYLCNANSKLDQESCVYFLRREVGSGCEFTGFDIDGWGCKSEKARHEVNFPIIKSIRESREVTDKWPEWKKNAMKNFGE